MAYSSTFIMVSLRLLSGNYTFDSSQYWNLLIIFSHSCCDLCDMMSDFLLYPGQLDITV